MHQQQEQHTSAAVMSFKAGDHREGQKKDADRIHLNDAETTVTNR